MVVRDRLAEMRALSPHCKEGEEVEMKPLKGAKAAAGFDTFLAVAEEINADVEKVKKNVEEMKTVQKRILTEPAKSERDKFQAKHNDLVEENKKLGHSLQRLIKAEQAKIEEQQKKGKHSSQDLAELRLKKTQITTSSNRFLEIWTEYNTLQVEFRERVKKELAKTVKITNFQLTQEEIEEKIDAGDVTVFSSIIKETAQAKEQLVALENRHADMVRLEVGITEIASMFADLAMLVEQQGEMLNRIEDHVNTASIDVERGRENLGKAEGLQKSARKKKIILGALLALAILILLLVILSEFGAFSGGGGETTVIQHIYKMPDGSSVISEVARPDLEAKLVPTSAPANTIPGTVTKDSEPATVTDSEGIDWAEDPDYVEEEVSTN